MKYYKKYKRMYIVDTTDEFKGINQMLKNDI